MKLKIAETQAST